MILRLESRPTSCSTFLTIAATALLGLGIVMVFSANASLQGPGLSKSTVLKDPAIRQAMYSTAALVALLMVGLCPYQSWRIRRGTLFQPAVLIMIGTLILLVVVLLPWIGSVRNGARRWISLGPSVMGLGFQPSEIAKLALVIFLAAYCGHLKEKIRRFWIGFLPALLILGLVAALVGVEDLGTGLLLALVGVGIIVGAGAKIWHLILLALPASCGLVHLIMIKPYRLQRLTSFLHPETDPQGAGYHQIQSLLTIASGGWWGRGLGIGIQKYGYLPEGRTDFIFSVICEELGLLGGLAVLALFGVLVWQGRRAMIKAPSEFGRLLALGATLTIGLQAAINIAVVTVSVPTKGIALPFVSAGGTGVIFLSILTALLINVARGPNTNESTAVTQTDRFDFSKSRGLQPARLHDA